MDKIKVDKNCLKKVADKFSIDFIILFGSKITGKGRKESDLDIAVKFKNKIPSPSKIGKL